MPPRVLLLLLVAVVVTFSGVETAAATTCDAFGLPAPSVKTLMTDPANTTDIAWIVSPDCTREIVTVAWDTTGTSVPMLNCSEKRIGRIESIPSRVERLYFDNNDVTEADLTAYPALYQMILAWCHLTSADGIKLPSRLGIMDFDGNRLKGAANGTIPDTVKVLYLSKNWLSSLANFSLPAGLTSLYLHQNNFTSINFIIPDGVKELIMDDNRELSAIEGFTMPDSLTKLSCVGCGVTTFRGVQLSVRLSELNFGAAIVTDFEIRESDVPTLRATTFTGSVVQTTCKDANATMQRVRSVTACVISDAAFEKKYADRLQAVSPIDSGSKATSSAPSAPSPSAPSLSSSSSNSTAIIVAVVAGIVVVMVAIVVYLKCFRKKNDESVGDKYVDVSGTGQPGSSAATGIASSGSGAVVGSQEYLRNDVRNDPALIMHRIAYDEVQIVRMIARGGFGVIYLGKFRGRQVAVKQILPDRAKDMHVLRSFMDEIRLCASLEHPRIVEFVGLSWSTLQDVAVVSEFMGGGDLHEALRARTSAHPSEWFDGFDGLKAKNLLALDIADAIVYLHSFEQPIVHRDLKARNVLLNCEGDAKLSDFGISREVALDETMTGEIGTVAWIAPEVLRGERYSEKADIYSLGVLLVELDTAQHPYRRELEESSGTPQSNTRIALLVSSGRLVPSTSPDCPSDMAALIARCLRYNHQERPSALDIHYELRKIIQRRSSN